MVFENKLRRATYLKEMAKIDKLKKYAKIGGYAFQKAQNDYKNS